MKSDIYFEQISKYYSGVAALEGISFKVQEGTIHDLAGENGSGKSTLLRILSGMESPSEGHVKIGSDRFSGIRSALSHGISMVTQEPSLVESLTVMENIVLGSKNLKKIVNWQHYRKIAEQCMTSLGFYVDPTKLAGDLPPALSTDDFNRKIHCLKTQNFTIG